MAALPRPGDLATRATRAARAARAQATLVILFTESRKAMEASKMQRKAAGPF